MKIESRELPCGTDRSPTTPYFQLSTPNSQLSTILRGLVIKNTGSWYLVKTDEGTYVECKIKGNFRLKGIRSTNPVAVGDHVQIILNQEGTAFINEIEDRKNYIIRRSSNLSKQSHILAANLDQCMLVVTVNYPETSTTFIDRFLASAEAYRVPVNIIFNKADAYNEDELRYLNGLINLYTTIGYPCFKISAKTGEGVDTIKEKLKGKITLFSGHSGVGKSTLINAILPELDIKTGAISAYHNKEGLRKFFEQKPDVLVADVMMPRMDGFEMVRRIRQSDKATPVLFLTARSAINDVVKGFELGANDYLKKPFGMQELIVRLKALMHKAFVEKEITNTYTIGEYQFNSVTQQLDFAGNIQELSHRESEILKRLCENRNEVVNSQSILLELWGDDSFFNSRSLHVFITKLRHKLSKDNSIRIVNVRGIGYKLIIN